jgi:hypothetical protein
MIRIQNAFSSEVDISSRQENAIILKDLRLLSDFQSECALALVPSDRVDSTCFICGADGQSPAAAGAATKQNNI